MNDGSADPLYLSQFNQIMASGRRNRLPQYLTDASVIANTTAGPTMAIKMDKAAASGSLSNPTRKRSRASKRAPTTILNTDTSNFRDMVQQFTGLASVPYAACYIPSSATTVNFGIGYNNLARPQPFLLNFGFETGQNQYQYQQQQQQEERHIPPQQNLYLRPPQQKEMIGFGVVGNIENNRRQVLVNPMEVGFGLPEELFLDRMAGR